MNTHVHTFGPAMRQGVVPSSGIDIPALNMRRFTNFYRTMRREGMTADDARMSLVHAVRLGMDIRQAAVQKALDAS
jgi:hypothetical protein